MSDQNNNKVQDKTDLKPSVSGADAGVLSNQVLDEMIRNRQAAGAGTTGSLENSVRPGSGSNSPSHDGGGIVHGISNGEKSENGKQTDRCPESMQHPGRHQFELLVRPKKDGVSEMGTGDKLVKDGDREILFMPNGDKLTVNKDGSFDLKANGPVQVKKQGDTTTITYPNGDTVKFGSSGVESVTRGNMTVEILDRKIFNSFPGDVHPRPPVNSIPNLEGSGSSGGHHPPSNNTEGGLKKNQ